MHLTRRTLLASAAPAMALAAAGCTSTTNATTGVVTYGLDPTVVTTIQNAVTAIANYAPTVESIAATAAGLFGPQYAAIVSVGSAAVNTVITALTNLVSNLPVGARRLGHRYGATPAGTLRGYAKTPGGYVPIYSQ